MVVNHRRQKNNITGLIKGETWFTIPQHIKTVLFDHFNHFLDKNRDIPTFSMGLLSTHKIPEDTKVFLERPFTLQEALLALKKMNSNKSPGPDGINAACVKHCWNNLQHHFYKVLDKFYHSGDIPVGLNSSFVALIPKKDNPTHPSDFRPISLINNTMKILLKLLDSRLKIALPRIISEDQLGFMAGRRISDAILIISEIFHSMKSKRCKGIILKLDFEKAFDTVNWDFLFNVLTHMNFGTKWIM